MKLGREETRQLVRRSRRERVTLNNVAGAAILLAAARKIYEDRSVLFRNCSFGDLRPYLKPPISEENLGTFHSMMFFPLKIRSGENFWSITRKLNDLSLKAMKKGEKFVTPLMSPMLMRMFLRQRKSRMGVTAVSYSGVLDMPEDFGSIKIREVHAFITNFVVGPEYTAQVRIFNGEMYWDIVYLDCDMDQDFALEIAGEIQTILVSGERESG
jgi:hypothetical protein